MALIRQVMECMMSPARHLIIALGCRWVEGELLQFTANNPLTRGAELGFVWVLAGEKRFVILLNRIDLDNPGV